jgi:hypothetical protein
VVDGAIYFSDDPAAPKVGDTRVFFSRLPPWEIQILARQEGNGITHFRGADGKGYLIIRLAGVPLFPQIEAVTPNQVWTYRLASLVLLCSGLWLLRSILPNRRPSLTLVILVGLAIASLLSANAWRSFSPARSGALAAFAGGAILVAGINYRQSLRNGLHDESHKDNP